jgi:hypothetical protein
MNPPPSEAPFDAGSHCCRHVAGRRGAHPDLRIIPGSCRIEDEQPRRQSAWWRGDCFCDRLDAASSGIAAEQQRLQLTLGLQKDVTGISLSSDRESANVEEKGHLEPDRGPAQDDAEQGGESEYGKDT